MESMKQVWNDLHSWNYSVNPLERLKLGMVCVTLLNNYCEEKQHTVLMPHNPNIKRMTMQLYKTVGKLRKAISHHDTACKPRCFWLMIRLMWIFIQRRHSTAPLFTRGFRMRVAWHIFTPNALPDATPAGFVFPPGIKLSIFCLLGKCVTQYTTEHEGLQSLVFIKM